MPGLAEALLQALADHGAACVFGIPGDFALPLFRCIEESGILPLRTLSHEPAVGFAADAAARYHGGIGVAAVTYGAGAFNLVNAVAGAYAERSPVVVVSGAPGASERSSGLLLHHQARSVDTQLAVFREVTCDQTVLDDPGKAPSEIARVLRSACERSLPVYIELPRDLSDAPCEAAHNLPPSPFDAATVDECADEVAARLQGAKRPVLVVDVEVRRYGIEAQVAELARRWSLPVVTTFLGRGLLSNAADVLRGTYMGLAGSEEVRVLVEESDAALLLGVIFCDTNFALSERVLDPKNTLVAADRSVRIAHHHYHDTPLDALVEAVLARAPRDSSRPPPVALVPAHYRRNLPADEQPLSPSDVATAINDLFDRHGAMPMTSDVGDCLFLAMEIENTALAAPGYYAGMGFGVPAAIGIAAAAGVRPLVLVGDGAFQMTGFELGNCRRYGLDPIVLVLNNRSWEMLRVFQPESRFNDLDDWHFAEIAPHLGAHGVRVSRRRELVSALEQAVTRRGQVSLIEVMLPRGETSETLARFALGIQAARRPRVLATPR